MSALSITTRTRRSLALGVALMLPALLVACGSSDDKASDSKKTTTTEAPGTVKEPASTTTAPADPEAFDEGIDKMNASLDAAGGDVCKMLTALQDSSAVGNPSTPEQAKAAYSVIESTLNAIADAAPAESAADATVIRDGVSKMMEAAQSSNYSLEEFNAGGPKAISTEEFGLAMSRLFQQVGTKCGLAAAGAGSASPETSAP